MATRQRGPRWRILKLRFFWSHTRVFPGANQALPPQWGRNKVAILTEFALFPGKTAEKKRTFKTGASG
jgi:hypothetical protein